MNCVSNEKGAALIETSILLPLLLLFVFAGLEYSRVLERSQWVSQISRELTNVTYRSCSASTGAVLKACIRRKVIGPLSAKVETLAPGSQFVVAVYTYEGGVVKEEGIEGKAKYYSDFRDSGFKISDLQKEADRDIVGSTGRALKRNELVVVGTVFSPIQGFARRIIPGMSLVTPDLIRSTTVM